MKEMVFAGPAPGRPSMDAPCVPLSARSSTVACRADSIFSTLPAAAVPVSVKIPEPITAPIPSAVRLHGPSDFRSCFSGSCEAAISASMLRVRRSDVPNLIRLTRVRLALALTLCRSPDLLLHRSARNAGGSFGLRRRFLARCSLQFLTLFGGRCGLCIHRLSFLTRAQRTLPVRSFGSHPRTTDFACALFRFSPAHNGLCCALFRFSPAHNGLCCALFGQDLVSPAYFSTNFFSPWFWKMITSFVLSPSPSRRTIVPRPYLGCSTTVPVRAGCFGGGGALGNGFDSGARGGRPMGRGGAAGASPKSPPCAGDVGRDGVGGRGAGVEVSQGGVSSGGRGI